VNQFDETGLTALHVAVLKGWMEGAGILLSRGASMNEMPDATETKGIRETPLHTAVRLGNVPMLLLLLGELQPPKHKMSRTEMRDHYCCVNGVPSKTLHRRFTKENDSSSVILPDFHSLDGKGRTILHVAAASLSFEVLSIVLQYKPCEKLTSAVDSKGNTILHAVFTNSHVSDNEDKIISCLDILPDISHFMNAKNQKGVTPIFLAVKNNKPKTLEYIIQNKGDPYVVTNDDWSLLHIACRANAHDCLKLLLSSEASYNMEEFISKETKDHMTPFQVAASFQSLECLKVLLNSGDNLSNVDSRKLNRYHHLVENIPSGGYEFLEEFFNEQLMCDRKCPTEADFEITYNYSPLVSRKSEDKQCSLITDLIGSKNKNLVSHPLILSFLMMKWNRIKMFFYLSVLTYILFLSAHTFYIIRTFVYSAEWSEDRSMLNMFKVFHIITFVSILVPDIVIMVTRNKKVILHLETIVKVVALASSAILVFSPVVVQAEDMAFERRVAAVSIFFSWVEFMLLLGRFPIFGIFILMFASVAKSLTKFLIAFSILIIGFSMTFAVIFKQSTAFRSLPRAFVKTIMMMIGDIDYTTLDDEYKHEVPILGFAFLIAFLFLVPIIMANLLIALAVNAPDLKSRGKVSKLSKQVIYLQAFEIVVESFKNSRCFPRSLRQPLAGCVRVETEKTIKPNKMNLSKSDAIWRFFRNPPFNEEVIGMSKDIVKNRKQVQDKLSATEEGDDGLNTYQPSSAVREAENEQEVYDTINDKVNAHVNDFIKALYKSSNKQHTQESRGVRQLLTKSQTSTIGSTKRNGSV